MTEFDPKKVKWNPHCAHCNKQPQFICVYCKTQTCRKHHLEHSCKGPKQFHYYMRGV